MARRKGLSFYRKRHSISTTVMKEIGNYLFIVVAAILCAYVVVTSFGVRTSVIGVSMDPELYNGQEVLINRFVYKLFAPKAGDVVAFLPNGNQNSHYYVKRVVAVPGDTVRISDGILYVNEVPYTGLVYDKIADAGIVENEITLGTKEFFVMGDNVNNSEDSRSGNIGAVKRGDIVGKVWFHMAAGDSSIGLME